MRFVQISNLYGIRNKVKIKTLSPSMFSWVSNGCAYQVLLQKALATIPDDSYKLPTNKNTVLGTIAHNIIEKVTKKELNSFLEMKDMWEVLVLEEENRLASLYPTLHNVKLNDYDKRNKVIKYALEICNMLQQARITNEKDHSIIVYSEKHLDCKELGLYGIADKIVIDNGFVSIVDYKSGYVFDSDNNIKNEYVVQLHLYASMCEHLLLGKIKSLSIIDIDGKSIEVHYSPEKSKELINQVQDKILELNKIIVERRFEAIAKRDPEYCHNCSCRHVCEYMVQSEEHLYQTISGYIESIPSNNLFVIISGESQIYISGLAVYDLENIQSYVGSRLVFLNIMKSSQIANNNIYKITENTLIYELM